jgi:uncharacterized protein with von Willebrand factor type A (vWA) domain
MKAKARLITGSVMAKAHVIGDIAATAYGLPGIQSRASMTEQSGLHHFMTVTPTEPQQLIWLNPQTGIDYNIETSTGLHWKII